MDANFFLIEANLLARRLKLGPIHVLFHNFFGNKKFLNKSRWRPPKKFYLAVRKGRKTPRRMPGIPLYKLLLQKWTKDEEPRAHERVQTALRCGFAIIPQHPARRTLYLAIASNVNLIGYGELSRRPIRHGITP